MSVTCKVRPRHITFLFIPESILSIDIHLIFFILSIKREKLSSSRLPEAINWFGICSFDSIIFCSVIHSDYFHVFIFYRSISIQTSLCWSWFSHQQRNGSPVVMKKSSKPQWRNSQNSSLTKFQLIRARQKYWSTMLSKLLGEKWVSNK